MKTTLKIVILFFSILMFKNSYSQRILFQSDFENISLQYPDSIPLKWKKLDADSNLFGRNKGWAVRDTNQNLGGDTNINKPRAHSGKKSLHISWFAGEGGSYIADDWVWTDSLRIQPGDSLIFWGLLGSTPGIALYVDSLQIWICSAQSPQTSVLKLSTIKSNLDSAVNVWTQYKFNLSSFNGQKIYIGFRYYIPSENALWCNIDDMFIGNRSYIGIQTISTEIPEKFSLSQNYPNPFNPTTKINYEIKSFNFVSLKIYDINGKEIADLVAQNQNAGKYSVTFDASNLPTGIYFYRLVTKDFSETKVLTFLK
ncbi:MAG: T9SS type A sorting domain-containing protein [Bacteroidetes bacterium]|nr:T9SS type A sorting domain-containing protein [Bacteroidota bacterium]